MEGTTDGHGCTQGEEEGQDEAVSTVCACRAGGCGLCGGRGRRAGGLRQARGGAFRLAEGGGGAHRWIQDHAPDTDVAAVARVRLAAPPARGAAKRTRPTAA